MRLDRRFRISLVASAVLAMVVGISVATITAGATSKKPSITYVTPKLNSAAVGEVFAKVPVHAVCQMKVFGKKLEVISRSVKAESGILEFSWTVPPKVTSGVRSVNVICSGEKAVVDIKVQGNTSGRELPLATHIHVQVVRSTEPAKITGKGGVSFPPYGTVLVSAASWFGGHGVNVYSNGSVNDTGYYQCVELANQFMVAEHFGPAIWGNANLLYADAPTTYYDKFLNGSGYVPVPGDLIVLGGGAYGHVVVVDTVAGSYVNVVEQNASPTGRNDIPLSGSTLGTEYGMSVIGIIHAKANGTPPPPPPPPSSGNYGPYLTTNTTIPLNERSAASTGASLTGTLSGGTSVYISCQTKGTNVNGSSIWDKLVNGSYVSDYWVNTPVFASWSPPIPQCSGGSPPPSPTSYGPYHTTNTTIPLNERSTPSTSATITGALPGDSTVYITCQTTGTNVGGTDIWDQLSTGSYVSDYWVNTPNFNAASPPIPHC